MWLAEYVIVGCLGHIELARATQRAYSTLAAARMLLDRGQALHGPSSIHTTVRRVVPAAVLKTRTPQSRWLHNLSPTVLALYLLISEKLRKMKEVLLPLQLIFLLDCTCRGSGFGSWLMSRI